jgi:hypothetical protein
VRPGREHREVKTSCRSETKYDIGMAPTPKLFDSARRLQEQRPQHRKLSWVRVLTRMISVARKISKRKNVANAKFVGFGEEIRGTTVTNPKTVLGTSLGEEVVFRDNFFYDIKRHVTLGMTYDMTLANPRQAATIGVATPTQNAICGADEPRNATRHYAGKKTPSVTTPTQDSKKKQMSLGYYTK